MGKRWIIVITLLLVTGIFAGWYLFVRESRYLGTSPLNAIPAEAPVFVRIRNLGEYSAKTIQNSGWHSLLNVRSLAAINHHFLLLDSLVLHNKQAKEYLLHKELFVVPEGHSTLFLLETGTISEKKYLTELIKIHFQNKRCSVTESKFKESVIQKYTWMDRDQKKQLHLSFCKGLLIFGEEELQLKKAIEKLDQPIASNDSDYRLVNHNTTVNADLNIYINHKTLYGMVEKVIDNPKENVFFKPDFAKWTEVDVIQKSNLLFVNGYTVADTTYSSYLSIFRQQVPLKGTLIKWMPASTTFFAHQNLSNPQQYLDAYQNYLTNSGVREKYQNQVDILAKELNLDIKSYLKEHWNGEAAVVFSDLNIADQEDNRYLLLKIKTGKSDPFENTLKRNSLSEKKKPKDPETEEAAKYKIWKMPVLDFGILVGEPFFGSLKTKWVTFAGDFLLMGPSPGSIRRYLKQIQEDQNLSEAPSYQQFAGGLALQSTFHVWLAPAKSFPFFESSINDSCYQNLLESTGNLNKIANISWQLGNENGFTYNTASLSIQPEGIQKAAPFWVFLPEAKTVGKPEFISWSEKESHRDLIFQDSENNLTVVDKDGLERWRVRLEGPVMGNIKTIDFYRNGDFQVLFNTAKALHMLNRNGREMKNFPVKLKSPATNEVSVCDYSDTKEYRFLLACKDRKVYNFDKTGKTISGWQVPTTSQVVTMPVQHYLSGKKDYIIIREEDNILFLDRQGKQRMKLKEKFIGSKNNIFLINNMKGDPVFLTTDQNGELIFIASDGSVKRKSYGNYTSNHAFSPIYKKLEGISDFLFYDQQMLSMYDFTGNLLYSRPVKNFTGNNVRLTADKSENFIELCSVSENRSVFFKSDCSIIDTFVPNDCRLLTMGSFYKNSSVKNILGLTQDGLLANFQIEFK